jgi:translocation and assembly module TamB
MALESLHRDAHLGVHLDATKLTIGNAAFSRGSIAVTANGRTFDARVRLEAPDGFGDVRLNGALAWGASVAPEIDASRPMELAFDAKNLQLAAAKPFLEGTFAELDGAIDADVRARAKLAEKTGEISGRVALSKGVFEIPAIGSELRDAHAQITMHPWGTLRFDDVGAAGVTGRLSAHGTATLEGLRFVAASAHLEVPRNEPLPITVEGTSLGEASGTIDAKAQMAEEGRRVDVTLAVPSLHVELPQSTSHQVQSLDPDKTIQVGVHRPDGRFVLVALGPPQQARPEGAPRLHVAINLGRDVDIRRDHTLKLPLTGTPVVDVADTARLSGEITLLAGGEVEVQGKRFKIEKGTVNFTGQEPENPIVVATATYDAPDGTRVFADFTGPMKTGKVVLRSEPQHSPDEILAILLFGSPEGAFGAEQPPGRSEGAAAAATGLAGNFVAQGLNRALAGITGVELATRVDTSQAGNPRPELLVQVAKNVAIEAEYNLGTPGPGQNPDRTLLKIDWRFVRRWLLETTIGDKGSSWVDVLWNYRY